MRNASRNDIVTDVPGRVLGIDYGSKRVGLAVSDPLRVLARAVGTWDNDAALPGRLQSLLEAEQVSLIIVGMPFAPDGGVGSKGREVERFMERLRLVTIVPLAVWDESYTTVDAHNALVAAGVGRKRRRERGRVDAMAARILLQQYLDAHQTEARPT